MTAGGSVAPSGKHYSRKCLSGARYTKTASIDTDLDVCGTLERDLPLRAADGNDCRRHQRGGKKKDKKGLFFHVCVDREH